MNKTQIKILIDLALASGKIACKYFDNNVLEINKKSDNSPVTKADKEISELIKKCLEKNFKDISIICEEGQNREVKGNKFWLIDPIDGTKGFIAKKNEFTINIAFIENNIPVFGLIYAPKILDAPLYYTDEKQNLICYYTKKNEFRKVRNINETSQITKIISSKRSTDEEIIKYITNNFSKIDISKIQISKMSSSFKFCKIIERKADLLFCLKPTMEWDSAAGHALILANGKKVLNLNHEKLYYKKSKFSNNGFIVTP